MKKTAPSFTYAFNQYLHICMLFFHITEDTVRKVSDLPLSSVK